MFAASNIARTSIFFAIYEILTLRAEFREKHLSINVHFLRGRRDEIFLASAIKGQSLSWLAMISLKDQEMP